ncbi:sex hormone-binding globulin [Alligator sinensis]|uniref:Sex hormone-binding globulin n=1 Tax=Alligator sinensis TaxID=38654 RepID=A0A3Q0FUF7_ALLSI|nr:sex hormone-binding globulin [Alligator sinensis]
MDGCMRRWDWLNQTVAWGQGSPGGPPKPCFHTLLPGSFFAGGGAIFTTADLVPDPPAPEGGWELVVELGVRAPSQTGLILAITDANASLVLSLSLTPTALTLRLDQVGQLSLPLPLGCPWPVDAVGLHVGPASLSLRLGAQHTCTPLAAPALRLRTAWTSPHGRLHLGALPEAAEGPGPFQGCLHGLQVQGQELDLDAALAKSNAIWSHGCPGNGGHRVGCTCP